MCQPEIRTSILVRRTLLAFRYSIGVGWDGEPNMKRRKVDIFAVKCVAQYSCVVFETKNSYGMPFYHTNLVLSIGEGFAVMCAECMTGTLIFQEYSM